KFYLLPFPFRYPGLGQIEFFPSFSSYVNYSRFEKNNKYVEFIEDLNSSNVYLPKNELNLIEKRFLTMGIDLEIYKFKNKNLPLTVSVYGTFNYNISEANFGTLETPITRPLKAFNRGLGGHLSTRRF